jgi:ABC-type phosphate transport system substrate-binding protein
MMRKLLVLSSLLSLVYPVGAPARAAAAEGYKVIVHPRVGVSTVSREQAARFFLKKETSWSGDKGVVPVDLGKDSPTRAAFSEAVLHRSVAEVTAYWQQQIYSGRSVPPVEMRTDAEVVAFVESNEGAIGYVSDGASTGDAKVVRVVE